MRQKWNEYFTRPQDRPSAPNAPTSFEAVVQQLGLRPEQYADSKPLRAWVERNKNERYVPVDLLKKWNLKVDAGF